jgi:hypothetical protein
VLEVVVRSWTFNGQAMAYWLSGGCEAMRKTSSRPFYTLLVGLVVASLPALGSAQSKVWIGKEKDYERFLTNAEIVSVEDVGSGVNKPKRIKLRQGARELEAMWKPIQRGPKEWAWESFEAEVAAYQLDRILGLHMVPPTVVRSIHEQEGSLQLWVTGVKFFRDTSAEAPQTPEWNQQLASCRLFDNLIANGARSSKDILVDEEWNLVLIDHSQAFLSSHYLDDDDEKLPDTFDRQLVARLENLDLEYMQFRFGRLLLDPQIRAIIMRRNALMRRIDKLVAEKGEDAVLFGVTSEHQ